MLEPQEVVTVWLAIDGSDKGNGCMRVIPGTHGHGFSDYEAVENRDENVFGTRIKQDQFDESKAVDLELAPGEFHLHHAKTIHGSNPNTSDRRRCGYTMRYMPAHVRFHAGPGWSHHLYLVRGHDRTGGHNVYTPVPE